MWLAEILKQPSKFDCLKHPSVLKLEELRYMPFHLWALFFFLCAVVHTLSVHKIHHWAQRFERKYGRKGKFRHCLVRLFYFFSEVEVVFFIWAIPLFLTMIIMFNEKIALEYINTRDYTEPLFVAVILSLASARPIIHLAEQSIAWSAERRDLFGRR